MKLDFSKRQIGAMTALEVLVVVVCVVVLAALLLPILARPRRNVSGISCVSNLRQISIALKIWAEDNNNRYPMAVSMTNGGAMELIDAGNLIACLRCASNEMSTTKIFVCPDDPDRTLATNWNDLNRLHVSYFLSADASNDTDWATVLSGDNNLAIGGKPAASGLVNVSSNAPISWFGARGGRDWGNLIYPDGSFEQGNSNVLQRAFQGTGLATNRIVVP